MLRHYMYICTLENWAGSVCPKLVLKSTINKDGVLQYNYYILPVYDIKITYHYNRGKFIEPNE